jgi:hypothetical protein
MVVTALRVLDRTEDLSLAASQFQALLPQLHMHLSHAYVVTFAAG